MERELNLAWHTTREIIDGICAHVPNVVIGIIVYCLITYLAKVLRKMITRVGNHAKLDATLIHTLGTLSSSALTVLAVLTAAVIIVPGFKVTHIITGLGLTSLAAGFAFKEILENFFAGLLLLWQKTFHLGDTIKTGEFEGIIEEIRIVSTRLRTENGELIIVPNATIFSTPIVVKTAYKNKRSQITVTGSPSRSVEANRKIIKQIIDSTEAIAKSPTPEILLTDISGGNQIFKIQFWTVSKSTVIAQTIDQLNSRIRDTLYQPTQHV